MNKTSILPKAGFGIVILMILGYVLFRFAPLLIGPSIMLVSPEAYTTTNQSSVDLVFETDRVTKLVIQGLDVDVSKNGRTTYTYQLAEGVNRIVVQAYDTYESQENIAILVLKNSGKPTQ